MDDNLVTITFPPEDVDAARTHYERLSEAARDLGRGSTTWKVSEGWFSIHLTSRESTDRLQKEAVPLPLGWTMRVGQSPP